MIKKIFCSPLFSPIFFIITWSSFFIYIYANCDFGIKDLTEAQLELALETPTYYLYGLLILTFLFFGKFFYDNKKIQYWCIYLSYSIFALCREMGLHKTLASVDTTPFKSRFFLKPENPISEKILAGLILILFFSSIVFLGIKYSKHLIKSFFEFNTTTWSLATFFVVLVFSQFMDRFRSNYYKYTERTLDNKLSTIIIIIEESQELMLPILVIIILTQYYILQKKHK